MTLRTTPYRPGDAAHWDQFVESALNGTIWHTRRYLSYHAHRFDDASCCIWDGERLAGVMIAAAEPGHAEIVNSHPGVPLGGLVQDGTLRGPAAIEAFELLKRHYAKLGFTRLLYKAVPSLYHRVPVEDDHYALFRLGARRTRTDLTTVLRLDRRLPIKAQRARSLRNARAAAIEIAEGPGLAAALWPLIEDNLARKHGAKPVHSLEEILALHDLFPDAVRFVVGKEGGVPVAGIVLYEMPEVTYLQYTASSLRGYELSALEAILDRCIKDATARGKTYFDFGRSTEQDGNVLNEGLFRFKAKFGGTGIVHQFYELDLV